MLASSRAPLSIRRIDADSIRQAALRPGRKTRVARPPSEVPAGVLAGQWLTGVGRLQDGTDGGVAVHYQVPGVVRQDMPWSRGTLKGDHTQLEMAQFASALRLQLKSGEWIGVYVVYVTLKAPGVATIILQAAEVVSGREAAE